MASDVVETLLAEYQLTRTDRATLNDWVFRVGTMLVTGLVAIYGAVIQTENLAFALAAPPFTIVMGSQLVRLSIVTTYYRKRLAEIEQALSTELKQDVLSWEATHRAGKPLHQRESWLARRFATDDQGQILGNATIGLLFLLSTGVGLWLSWRYFMSDAAGFVEWADWTLAIGYTGVHLLLGLAGMVMLVARMKYN